MKILKEDKVLNTERVKRDTIILPEAALFIDV